MKKIFLIPLLTLFMSINMWADVTIKRVDVSTKAELDAALAAAAEQDSTEITLTANIEWSTSGAFMAPFNRIVVPATAHVLLNLNGFGIKHTIGEMYYATTNANPNQQSLIDNQGSLHIISNGNSIVQMPIGSGAGTYAVLICNCGRLEIDGGIYIGSVAGITFGTNAKQPVIWNQTVGETTPKLIINGGTFLCNESNTDYNVGNLFPTIVGTCDMHIRGGIFSEDEMAGILSNPSTKEYIDDHNAETGYTTVLVPYTNAKIPGYNSATRTNLCPDPDLMPTMYNDAAYKNKYRYAVKPVCVVVPKTASTDNFLYVEPGATMTVADGETLHVGTGGIVMGDAASKIIVAAGGKLISEGEIVTSTPDNLHLTMDEVNKKYSYVAFHTAGPLAKHPDATVVLKSRAYSKGNGKYVYQRFAIPTYQTDIKRNVEGNEHFTYTKPVVEGSARGTAIFKWDYSANDWIAMMSADESSIFEPFQGYMMTNEIPTQGHEYTFKAELVGRGNAVLPLYAGSDWQYFGNSYTAPIDVVKLLEDLRDNKNGYLYPGVWAHTLNGSGWIGIGLGDLDDYQQRSIPLAQSSLEPMQAFVFYKTGSQDNTELDYNNLVFNPLLAANGGSLAPRRKGAATSDYTRATIAIEAADGTNDLVKVYEGSKFDANLDYGYDMPKLMNDEGVNMYFNDAEGNLARLASDNVANTAITIETKEATSYTMNFDYVTLEGYVLRDNLTGTETPLVSGYTYSFSAPANSKIEGRFEIVAAAHMPTAIDDVEVNANVKGIYTLTGQYMGENFHALPAGVYVINGKKVVK